MSLKTLIEVIPNSTCRNRKIKKDTYLNDNFTPFEVYIKFLIEYFGKSVEFDQIQFQIYQKASKGYHIKLMRLIKAMNY